MRNYLRSASAIPTSSMQIVQIERCIAHMGNRQIHLSNYLHYLTIMLAQLDFVDTRLASRVSTLERELHKIAEQNEAIIANNHINSDTKQRLISFNDSCRAKTLKLLEGEKKTMLEYLDEQLNVGSKIGKKVIEQPLQKHRDSLLNQSTRADISFNHSRTESYNGTQSHIGAQSQNGMQSPKISMGWEKQWCKKGSAKRVLIRRLKQKVANQQKTIQALINWIALEGIRFSNAESSLESSDLSERSKELQEINSLLKQKNELLAQRVKKLQLEIFQTRSQYQSQAAQIITIHKETERYRLENKELLFQRNRLLRTDR